MRIIYMGTPDFAVPSLEALVSAGFTPVAVATGPDKPRGRGRQVSPTPVKEAATRLGIDMILQPESVRDPGFAEAVRALSPDLIIVVAFRILPPEVYRAARLGAFNLHGSLLPRYRGAAPIHRAVMAGETETGVTTFFLKDVVDTGDLILQRSFAVGPDETTGDVHDHMMGIGAEVVVETVRLILAGAVFEAPQDERFACPAPKVFREEASIDWNRPVDRVHDFIRGLSPVPCAWTRWAGSDLKVYRSSKEFLAPGPSGPIPSPGTLHVAPDGLLVACLDGWIRLVEVQPEGRRRMTGSDFVRGYPVENLSRLGA